MSYETAVDIESVLAEVRQPVRQYSIKHDPGQPESYHHASLKKNPGTEDLRDEVCMCRYMYYDYNCMPNTADIGEWV